MVYFYSNKLFLTCFLLLFLIFFCPKLFEEKSKKLTTSIASLLDCQQKSPIFELFRTHPFLVRGFQGFWIVWAHLKCSKEVGSFRITLFPRKKSVRALFLFRFVRNFVSRAFRQQEHFYFTQMLSPTHESACRWWPKCHLSASQGLRSWYIGDLAILIQWYFFNDQLICLVQLLRAWLHRRLPQCDCPDS